MEENGDIWEEIETIDSDTEQENNNHYVAEGPISNEINNAEGSVENEMAKMLPKILDEFSKYGMENDLLTFFHLVSENRFPFSNIAFMLWLEIVRWYGQDSSSTMRYMGQTKMF